VSHAGQVPEELPGLEAAAVVSNDVPKQVSTIQANDFNLTADPPRKGSQANDPKNVLKTVLTGLSVYLTQISGRPDMSYDCIAGAVGMMAGTQAKRGCRRETVKLTKVHVDRAEKLLLQGKVPGRGMEWGDTEERGLTLRLTPQCSDG